MPGNGLNRQVFEIEWHGVTCYGGGTLKGMKPVAAEEGDSNGLELVVAGKIPMEWSELLLGG